MEFGSLRLTPPSEPEGSERMAFPGRETAGGVRGKCWAGSIGLGATLAMARGVRPTGELRGEARG